MTKLVKYSLLTAKNADGLEFHKKRVRLEDVALILVHRV